MTRVPKDLGASVRDRLLRLAQERGEDFQLVLLRYANERLLYRLATSRHASRFVLKGAALFTLWTGRAHRATRDVDLLGSGAPGETHGIFAEMLAADAAPDGVVFDAGTLKSGPIREAQAYSGIRLTLQARIASARVNLQVDVGFGDAVVPAALDVCFPPLLEFPAPRLLAYPRETVVAEKLEAMVLLGLANSRMKDFHDLALLARMFAFEGEPLSRAIRATFERRRTPLPETRPFALTPAFHDDPAKRTQWTAFLRKSGATDGGTLVEVVDAIAAFVERPLGAAARGTTLSERWDPGGPWK